MKIGEIVVCMGSCTYQIKEKVVVRIPYNCSGLYIGLIVKDTKGLEQVFLFYKISDEKCLGCPLSIEDSKRLQSKIHSLNGLAVINGLEYKNLDELTAILKQFLEIAKSNNDSVLITAINAFLESQNSQHPKTLQ